MTPEQLKASILKKAFSGGLVSVSPDIMQPKVKAVELNEAPFDVPEHWFWSTLGNCCEMYTGNSISESVKKAKYVGLSEGYDYIATKDVSFERIINYNNGVRIPENEGFRIAYKGSVLMCIEGGSAGRKIGILDRDVCFGNKLCYFNSTEMYNPYIYYYLQSHEFKSYFKDNMSGIIGGVSIKRLKDLPIPIPTMSEQKAIVSKIEELLPYVDRYAMSWEKLEHFNAKFPEDMRKSILQYAIQGKLVEQRPEEGTAEELYQQIQSEKQKLIKEGKIKKEKPLPEIDESEIPFDIPENWKWVRLGNISYYIDAGKSPNCKKIPVSGDEWGVITTTAIQNGYFDDIQNKVLPDDYEVNKAMQVHVDDILITRAGPMNRTGVACIVKRIRYNLILSDKTLRINITPKHICRAYVVMILNSPQIRSQLIDRMSGMDKQQVNISQDKYKTVLLPLPPLEEQYRIVAKIEELLPYCDRLMEK
jgi:type I restriction enzyme S subunit